MRYGHGDAVDAHGELHLERTDQDHDGLGHPGPLVVGLRSREEQEGHSRAVDDPVQQEAWVRVALPVVTVEDHGRPAAAVVEELVDVERGDDAGLVRLQEVLGEQALRVAGVDEPAQCKHEHRCVHVLGGQRRIGLELEQLGGVLHGMAFRHGSSSGPTRRVAP